MRSTIRIFITAVMLLSVTQLFGAAFSSSNRIAREFAVDPSGSVWIDNRFGNIDVMGGEGNLVSVTAERAITAPDAASLKDAADSVAISLGGDAKARLVQTIFPTTPRPVRWNVAVNYVIRLPRSVKV